MMNRNRRSGGSDSAHQCDACNRRFDIMERKIDLLIAAQGATVPAPRPTKSGDLRWLNGRFHYIFS